MTREGISTLYAGYQMRSRLEAHWACFFDALGWKWEYEPLDGHGYIPDFVLLGQNPVYVEVKPETTLNGLRSHEKKVQEGLHGITKDDILIVGLTPVLAAEASNFCAPSLGVLLEHGDYEDGPCWYTGEACWMTCRECGLITFHHDSQSYHSRMCGHYDGDHHIGEASMDKVQSLWARTSNRVQWFSGERKNRWAH